MRDIIIFADYGLDDAAATVSIFNRSHRFSSITLIPIGGNVPVDVSYRNCYTLISHFPELWDKIKVVSTCHINQAGEYLADIHGGDGMGDALNHPDKKPQICEVPFEEWLDSVTGQETVLSLGPMTLVCPLLKKKGCKELIIMGGLINEEPNFNGYEFNMALDVEAFEFCLTFPHVAITLDTCRVKELDMRRVRITGDDLHSVILRADKELSVTRGEDGCYVWDDVAACYALYPERFEVKREKDPHGNIICNAHYISDKLYFED